MQSCIRYRIGASVWERDNTLAASSRQLRPKTREQLSFYTGQLLGFAASRCLIPIAQRARRRDFCKRRPKWRRSYVAKRAYWLGSGFSVPHLIDRLLADGHEVLACKQLVGAKPPDDQRDRR